MCHLIRALQRPQSKPCIQLGKDCNSGGGGSSSDSGSSSPTDADYLLLHSIPCSTTNA